MNNTFFIISLLLFLLALGMVIGYSCNQDISLKIHVVHSGYIEER